MTSPTKKEVSLIPVSIKHDLIKTVELIKKSSLYIGTVESCTGGYLGYLFSLLPGASDYYRGSIVAYHESVKKDLVGLPDSLIDKRGTIDMLVTYELAKRGISLLDVDICLGITCAAGPTSPYQDVRVGSSFISIVSHYFSITKRFTFQGTRDEIRALVVQNSLNLLQEYL